MANAEHVEIVKLGAEAIKIWREQHPNERLDLSGAHLDGKNLEGADLTNADLRRAYLVGTYFANAVLFQADLRGSNLNAADLTAADLREANLSHARLWGAILVDADLVRAQLRHANSGSAKFTNARLHFANLRGADLKLASLDGASLNNANVRGADFTQAILEHAVLQDVIGLESSKGLETAHIGERDPAGFADTSPPWPERWADWERLRTLGNLPLFGLSYTVLIFVPLALYLLAWYNAKVDLVTNWADQVSTKAQAKVKAWEERVERWEKALDASVHLYGVGVLFAGGPNPLPGVAAAVSAGARLEFPEGVRKKVRAGARRAESALSGTEEYVRESASLVRKNLKRQPIPSQSLLLLASTVLLAAASTIYTLRCPSRVKEFTRDRWCDELRQPLIRYWPVAWKQRWLRLACAVFYVLGGLGALWVLVVKVWRAGWFIWENASFSLL